MGGSAPAARLFEGNIAQQILDGAELIIFRIHRGALGVPWLSPLELRRD